ncbi:cytochrome b/b6 domain-containing protein [Corynebacterium liangguodongii]|uniref:Uncharacterized protein n=1 Tax=Corynebacterium liangguodongii TaxID=2079535 RepID=A0A2S0WFJ9_9CORY|nr:cytochrome b/b6 domain-containing protein [Corynebacterium liangguodongii]AWB84536.1 hypothetical protein C3E79_08600 [Corynebacterium liangguodongii]PWB98880.1 cytochrome b/b6 domain-containing protein [Corynebacterium liangguodongii]
MQIPLRRGLPRVPAGEPWPPAGSFVELDVPNEAPRSPLNEAPAGDLAAVAVRQGLPRTPGGAAFPPVDVVMLPLPAAAAGATAAESDQTSAAPAGELTAVAVRQGLPRTPGGAAFPPVDVVKLALPAAALKGREDETAQPEAETPSTREPRAAQSPAPGAQPTQPGTARPGRLAAWAAAALSAGFAFAMAVLFARYLVSTEWGEGFTTRFDGRQPLPAGAPVGLPAWLNWAHFFNMFLMVLVIKTGLSVRRERRPEALWAPRGNPRAKISLTLWLHLALDIAWVALGAVFYVLLFTTGQWVRVVPTSWEVFPNALSAGLQYLTLHWPADNGWVHYNALQELTYFAVIFLAAPLAIVSGARMSPVWPKGWTFMPVSAARAIHFPTMIFFVVFIASHVALVALTGLRRNLNAMFAARGSVDPAAYATDWTGTIIFLIALAVVALGAFAARPVFIAPLARLTGTVSNR